jgi:hypothetical protein
MPLTIIDIPSQHTYYSSGPKDWASSSTLLDLTKFLQSEDVEIVHFSVAPDNVAVLATFLLEGWESRLDDLINGRANWASLRPPLEPAARREIDVPNPEKDMWDITQPTFTIHNLDDDSPPSTFRGSPGNVSWPSTLVKVTDFLVKEGSTIVSLLVTSRQMVLVTNMKENWMDRVWKAPNNLFGD